MAFKGKVLTTAELVARAQAAPEPARFTNVGLRHDAAGNARRCSELMSAGEPLASGWRYGILQTLDDYSSTLSRGGAPLAAQVFGAEPARTGAPEIDAAFAALAAYLAGRDGWRVPSWALDPSRAVEKWYAEVPPIFQPEADVQTPSAFRARGIFITDQSLERA